MKVTIISPVDHDGKLLEVGKAVDLPTDVAEALVKAGAAEAGKAKAGKAEEAGGAGGDQPQV